MKVWLVWEWDYHYWMSENKDDELIKVFDSEEKAKKYITQKQTSLPKDSAAEYQFSIWEVE